jgi:3'-5' exoribonuclease
MKRKFIKDLKEDEQVESTFMIMKKLNKDGENLVVFLGDKSGDIKSYIKDGKEDLKVGEVIYVRGLKSSGLQVNYYKREDRYDIDDFLPALSKPIQEIMKELEQISEEEFKSEEARALNDYFFKDEAFLNKFKRGIGGLSQHHNYIGGLAEHTLNVTYMAKVMAYRYDCRFKELAVLAAKLHDIGKIEEYDVNGPFSVAIRGEMEGHIVIGITMLEEAFRAGGDIYSEDFKHRLRGCVVQHHGKVEYGSPKAPNTEEAYIVHYADYIDATMNKIGQIKDLTTPGTWSDYDRRIGTRLYI